MKDKIPKKSSAKSYTLPMNGLLLSGIAALVFLCYHYSLGNQFTNWDDQRFINENIFIKSFSGENLKMMLFHDVTKDYYNPITILSYAVNYHFSGLAPQAYYLTNIVIHILNSFLVFFLVLALLKAMEKKGYFTIPQRTNASKWLALFCTLAFAIHPMHVESVSWIAERKDVLYAFFYIAGMLAYLRYTETEKRKYIWLALAFILFILSLLSKPMAIAFPFSLLAIDVLLKRDKSTSIKNIILEKIPFILIAILSIINTYHEQKLAGAVSEMQPYSFLQRFIFASYGFCMYALKAFVPLAQTSFYPYPIPSSDGGLPFIFYLFPLIALLVTAIPLYLSYRAGENSFRVMLFGFCFYFFNMIIVSQIVGSGPNIMAERYTYICYFGIFFPLTFFMYGIWGKIKPLGKTLLWVGASLYLLLFSIRCYERTLVWHNSETLWSEVIRQYPHRIVKAYNNLGNYYFTNRDLDRAYENYKQAIDLKPGDPQVYCNMGIFLSVKKNYRQSLAYFAKALELDSNDALTYVDRAISYSAMGQYGLAIKDYQSSARLNPNSEVLVRNMAYTYLNAQQFDSAIYYYTRVLKIDPANSEYFHYRGVAEYDKGLVKPALNDFNQDLLITPHDSECMFYLSITYNRLSDFKTAAKYAQMAQNARYPVPDEYIRLLKARLAAGE